MNAATRTSENVPGSNSPDLIARYVHAVAKYLPASRRGDILAELSANLLAEVDDKEEELGRPLTTGELSTLIKGHGRPFVVAAGYSPQRYLIGPAVFPYYLLILKVSITLSAFVYFLVNAIVLGVNGFTVTGVIESVLKFPFTALITALWITLVFAALEYAAPRYVSRFPQFSEWNPEALPPTDSEPTKPFQTIFDLFANAVGILWLASISHFPYRIFGPGAAYFLGGPLRATAAAQALYWPIIGILCAQFLVKAAAAIRSLWVRPLSGTQRLLLRLFNSGVGLLILTLVVRVHEYFVLVGDAAARAKFGHLADVLNTLASISVRVSIGVCAFMIFWDLGRFYFKTRTPKAAARRQYVQL